MVSRLSEQPVYINVNYVIVLIDRGVDGNGLVEGFDFVRCFEVCAREFEFCAENVAESCKSYGAFEHN